MRKPAAYEGIVATESMTLHEFARVAGAVAVAQCGETIRVKDVHIGSPVMFTGVRWCEPCVAKTGRFRKREAETDA